MPTQIFVLAIIALTVVAPILIGFHYITKWKSLKGLSDEEQKALEDLWHDSEGMESRINALETILDAEVPDWRRKL